MRHGLERVNVQAAVGLIENGIFRLEHRQMQNLGALLFAAGKTFVDRTRSERTIHPEQLDLFVKLCVIIGGLEFFAFRQTRLHRGTKKVGDRHAWNFARILEGHEQAAPRPFIRLKFKEILSVHQHLASGHMIIGVTSQHFGQGALSSALASPDVPPCSDLRTLSLIASRNETAMIALMISVPSAGAAMLLSLD